MLKIALFCILGLSASCQAGSLSDALLKSFANGDDQKDVIVEFPAVINSVMSNSQLNGLSGDERNSKIVSLMQAQTSASQAPILNALSGLGISEEQVQPFWVDNKVAIKAASLGPLQALAALPGAFTVREPFQAKVYQGEEVRQQKVSLRQAASDPPQWGVAKINAPAVWAEGYTGQGIVVGVIDTGVNVEHDSLKANYKNDRYSWKDAFGEHETAYDGNGHGTHCAGTIAGTVNGIGVAPGAKFIACRGLNNNGSGSEITLTTCGQFMACPSGNSTTNCTGIPNIVSNSWGGAVGGQSWFDNTIKLWNSVGIIGIFAIGNSGPLCFTAGSPGDRPGVIAVGSTDDNDQLSSFSSKGPSLGNVFGKTPTIAAPGRNIVSARHNDTTGYRTLSGTSMATPHVAGATALLLSAHPTWKREDVEKAFRTTAYQRKLSIFDSLAVCTVPAAYPNNAYGSGRIDVLKALTAKVQ